MSVRIETATGALWRFDPDPLPAGVARLRALLRARLIDEITGEPVASDIVATSDTQGLAVRVTDGGIVGLIGRPGLVFPRLGTTGAPLSLHVESGSYLPLTLARTLGPIAGFPGNYAPLDLGNVALHRRGTAFTGRTLAAASPVALPLGNATVSIAGLWLTPPPPNLPPGGFMVPPQVIGFDNSRLYAPRDHLSATASLRNLLPIAGQERALLVSAVPGDTRVRVKHRDALAAGVPLAFEPGNTGRREIVGIASVDITSTPDQPAWVTLRHPLQHLHRQGTACVPTTLPAPTGALNVTRDAIAGDCCAFLSAVPAWPDGAIVEISDAASPPEYHRARRYTTVSDTRGDFDLPSIARVAMVRLRAVHGGFATPVEFDVCPEYRFVQHAVTATFA